MVLSRCVLTIVLYNDKNVSLSRIWKVLQIIFFHLCCFVYSLINVIMKGQLCVYNESMTPKSFCFLIVSSGCTVVLSVIEY